MDVGVAAPAVRDLRVTDDFTAPGETLATSAAVSNPAFRTFIDATVAALGREGASSSGNSRSDLRFVRIALAASGNSVPAVPRAMRSSAAAGHCTIESPWVEASVSTDGSTLSAIVYWNERQVVRDQALLEGIAEPAGPARALPQDEFAAYAQDYGDALMRGDDTGALGIPGDLLWLFRRAPQSTRGPFGSMVAGEMARLASRAAEPYGRLVAELLLDCQRSAGRSLKFNNIKDVGIVSDIRGIA